MYKKIFLKRGKEDSLLRFHPWVFSGALQQMDNMPQDGELVEVFSNDGDFLAVGHFQHGTIAVRVLSFKKEEINRLFWEKRIAQAWDMRKRIGMDVIKTCNMFRLVHGEGDSMPGLIVDCYGDTAVMQAHSMGMHLSRADIAEAIMNVMQAQIKNIYYKSETSLPILSEDAQQYGFLYGGNSTNVAEENKLKFHVDWIKGQKTGFFIDQRDNRLLLERYSKGRNVLNMCCYTGGFSVYALRGGAALVHSVDSSAKAIEMTNMNVKLNFPDDDRHMAFCEDAFKFLGQTKNSYDLIVLDPPAFAKHRGALHNALKGYIRLNAKALEIIKPGGVIFTFSCSQVVTKDNFRNAVFTAAAQAKRQVRILHQLHQPADHPINIYHPEGEYLKGLVLYVE